MIADPHSLRYRPELDGIRAVAVLAVLVFHVAQPARFAGFVGVDVFFVLSGYLITTILLRELEASSRVALGRFYLRRLLRLYPALLVVLVVTFGFAEKMSGGSVATQAKDTLVAATYTANLYQTYRHHWLGGLSHTWSLALEEQYYLVWPIVLALALRAGARRAQLALVLGVAALVTAAIHVTDFSYGAVSYPIQSTSTGLLAGSALALVAGQIVHWWRPALLTGFGIALLAVELVTFSLTTAVPAGWYTPAAVVATTLVLAGTTGRRDGLAHRWLSIPLAVWLGRISYGIYLWHYPVLRIVTGYVDLPKGVLFVLVLAVTLALAAASHRFVEAPFLRLKSKLDRRGAPS